MRRASVTLPHKFLMCVKNFLLLGVTLTLNAYASLCTLVNGNGKDALLPRFHLTEPLQGLKKLVRTSWTIESALNRLFPLAIGVDNLGESNFPVRTHR